jgi:hypothetical protein
MKVVIHLFAGMGLMLAILWVSGSLGIGHFRLYYGPTPLICTK